MPRQFWVVHGVYWLIAGSALFASGLSQAPFAVAAVRNLFFGLGGYVVGIALVHAFSALARSVRRQGLFLGVCLILAYTAAAAMVALMNPFTQGQLGVPFDQLTWRHIMGGTMNYGLVMVLWSLIYLFLFEPRMQAEEKETSEALDLEVTDGRMTRRIRSSAVLMFKAAGDYVEVVTSEQTYLKRTTLAAMEKSLAGQPFLRVHRSVLVNRDRIRNVEGETKGRFELVLDNGEHLHASRSYRDRIHREIVAGNPLT